MRKYFLYKFSFFFLRANYGKQIMITKKASLRLFIKKCLEEETLIVNRTGMKKPT